MKMMMMIFEKMNQKENKLKSIKFDDCSYLI